MILLLEVIVWKTILFCLNFLPWFTTHRNYDPMALLSGIPTSLFNTWNKLVRHKHHSNFLFRCTKRSRIPKGLLLSFDLQLVKDNGNLQESCKQHLLAASPNILREVSEAAWSKTKSLQRQLNFEREKLFENYDETTAKTIWSKTRTHMERLEFNLLKKARRKFTLATPYNPAQEEVYHNHRTGESRKRKRRFTRNLSERTAKKGQIAVPIFDPFRAPLQHSKQLRQ